MNETNIYYQALTQYLNYLKNGGDQVPDTIYIEDDFRLTDSLLLQSGQTRFIKLNYEDRVQLLTKRKSIILYRLFPLAFNDGVFSVSFVPFTVTKKKAKTGLYYSNPGGWEVIFKFGTDGKFSFIKIEDHGI